MLEQRDVTQETLIILGISIAKRQNERGPVKIEEKEKRWILKQSNKTRVKLLKMNTKVSNRG